MFETIQLYCMFVGYPRSGHSLVGTLLDAHPDIVIAHELDALRHIRAGCGNVNPGDKMVSGIGRII